MPWHEAPTGPAASPPHGGPESATPVPDVPVPDAEQHYGLVWGDDLVRPEAAS
jgi:hypothetical protein